MKRSRTIHRDQMRKVNRYHNWAPMTVVVLGATVVLSGCGQKDTHTQYDSLQDCINADSGNSKQVEMCETAYQQAMDASPKFDSKSQCHSFGADDCQQVQTASGGNYWVPVLAGFIIGRMMDNNRRYVSHPVYYPSSNNSSRFDRWIRQRNYDASNYRQSTSHNYKTRYEGEKKAVTRTISRGGFGSKASAKSSWGGSRSRGWGG